MGINIVGPAAKSTRYLRQALVLIGPKYTGKSTLADVFRTLLGTDNITALPLSAVNTDFGKADLIGRDAWIADDVMNENTILDPNAWKVLVSGEPINTDVKHKDRRTFHFTGAIMLTGNALPRIKDNSGAAIERMSIVKLKNRFSPADLHKTLDGCSNLIEYLHRHDEFPGIINWALQGFRDAFDAKKLAKPRTISDFAEMYRRDSTPMYDFVRDVFEENSRYAIHADAVAALATEFAAQRHDRRLSLKDASREITSIVEETMPNVSVEHDESNSRIVHFVGAKLTRVARPFWDAARDRYASVLKDISSPDFRL
jgi:P4 family phage/plasmid primase-like protien